MIFQQVHRMLLIFPKIHKLLYDGMEAYPGYDLVWPEESCDSLQQTFMTLNGRKKAGRKDGWMDELTTDLGEGSHLNLKLHGSDLCSCVYSSCNCV